MNNLCKSTTAGSWDVKTSFQRFMQPGSRPSQTRAETTFLSWLQSPGLPNLPCQLNYITSVQSEMCSQSLKRFSHPAFLSRNVMALGKSDLFNWTRVRSHYLTRYLLLRYFILHHNFFICKTEMVIPNRQGCM